MSTGGWDGTYQPYGPEADAILGWVRVVYTGES